jgi:hypothetical protein
MPEQINQHMSDLFSSKKLTHESKMPDAGRRECVSEKVRRARKTYSKLVAQAR